MKQYEVPDSLFTPVNTISSINNSLQSKQLFKLKPTSLIENKKISTISYHKPRQDIKIANELRGAVEALKSRLKRNREIIKASYPSSRLKIAPNSQISPDKYHRKSESTGGFEFTKSTRMDDSLNHKLETLSKYSKSPKKQSRKQDFELKNIQTVRDFSEYFTSVKEKTKDHNQKVAKNAANNKLLKHEQREKKKSVFLNHRENIKWKESCRLEIRKGKRIWSLLFVFCVVPCWLKIELIKRKHYKEKILGLINQFRIFSKYLGKLLTLLKRKRTFLLHRNVRVFATPTTQYILKQSNFFSKEISKFLFRISNSDHFIRLIISWKKKVVSIQKLIKNFLSVRQAQVLALSLISNKSHTKTSRRPNEGSKELEDSQIVFPSQKKKILEYIRSYSKKQVSQKKPIFLFTHLKTLQDPANFSLF